MANSKKTPARKSTGSNTKLAKSSAAAKLIKTAPKPAGKPAPKKNKKPLSRDTHRLGNSFIFPPNVIDDIHIKSELGRYRMRGFSLFKKIPSWDDLTFLPGTLTPQEFGEVLVKERERWAELAQQTGIKLAD